MKLFFFFYSIALTLSAVGQSTYSTAEGKRFAELNHLWGAARTYASKPYYTAVLDSFDLFLKQYPHSLYRTGILNYKLELTSIVSKDAPLLAAVADEILELDSIPQTKLGIAEIFITKNRNADRGARMVEEILPQLTVTRQICLSHILLAQYDIARGKNASAKHRLRYAISLDSARTDAWYALLSLAKSHEDRREAEEIEAALDRLQMNETEQSMRTSETSPNLLKNISALTFKDLSGKDVPISSLNGKIVVLDCFAFWCSSCLPGFEVLHRLEKEFPTVIFLYLNMPPEFAGGNPKDTKRFLSKDNYRYLKGKTILFPSKDFFDNVGTRAVPTTFIIDKHGVIRYDYIGFSKGLDDNFRTNIKQLLSEQ